MNDTTLKEFNRILDKAQVDIITARKQGTGAETIHFGTILELITLILERVDQVEANLKK